MMPVKCALYLCTDTSDGQIRDQRSENPDRKMAKFG